MSLLTASPLARKNQELILAKLSDLPPFSPVLNQLLASLGDESFSFRQLGSLIEQDTVLTGNVLRMVNSAAYGRRVEVLAISKAVSILGLNKLRNLVLTLSVANMWRSVKVTGDWSLERFNQHELATAILCDALAQRTDTEFPEGAFLGGLLHDLGKLLIVMASPADYLDIEAEVARGRDRLEAERLVLETDHAELSAAALALWKLPPVLEQAVRDHHLPIAGQLSTIISVADECANRLGLGVAAPAAPVEGSDGELGTPALARLRLAGEAEAILMDFRTEFDVARSVR